MMQPFNMDKRLITEILAHNLKKALDEHPVFRGSGNALSKTAKVAQTSISYMLNPKSRAPTKRGDSSPKISQVDRVARALGLQAWQLVYPDPDNRPVTDRESELHKRIESALVELRAIHEERAPYE